MEGFGFILAPEFSLKPQNTIAIPIPIPDPFCLLASFRTTM